MIADANLIVGGDAKDDAAVYAIGPDQAVVFTVDCLTPIHDDPVVYGEIVAANCLSDVWAMGGRPLLAINICGFPQYDLPLEVLRDILRGGMTKATEAGVLVAGGHTMRSPEPFYGMAVVGLVNPRGLVTNAGAQPGDHLVLTKALGTGLIATAMMNDEATEEGAAAMVASTTSLNKVASEVMVELGATAATDVTGFGLLGHSQQLAAASGVELVLRWDAIPALPTALELAAEGGFTGGGVNNRDDYGQFADFGGGSEAQITVVCDPQTSGGLLIAFPPAVAESAIQEMQKKGVAAAEIGEVKSGTAGKIRFV